MKNIFKCLVLASLVIALFASACTSHSDIISKNKQVAKKIIEAIDEYRQDHDSFPDQLNVLVPLYMEEVPKTTLGHSFIYELDEREGYSLLFKVSERDSLSCGYTPRSEFWDCSYGD